MSEYYCEVDGCSFSGKSQRSLTTHCTKVHSIENNPYRIECDCKQCGDSFSISKGEKENGQGTFCSKECKGLFERNRIECECDYCNESFTIRVSRIKQGCGDFCSRECQGKYKTENNTVECNCSYCGDTFTVSNHDYSRGVGKYCSRGCYGLDNRENNVDIRNSVKYIQWRKDVLQRDSYECQDCGSECNLHVHHIIPVSENESKATDVDNGVTLCIDCHALRHEKRGEKTVALLIKS